MTGCVRIVVMAVITGVALPAHAFNALGHTVIAEVAWQELLPEKWKEIVLYGPHARAGSVAVACRA